MAAVEVTHPPARGPDGVHPEPAPAPRAPARGRRSWSGPLLVSALLVVCLGAAFASGATSESAQAWLTLALGLMAVAACAAWLWERPLSLRAPALAWGGVALLAGYAAWAGASLIWSITPDETWLELNRMLAYLLVVVLALAAGRWDERAVARTAIGYLVVAVLVALYALGGKVAPGLHVAGVFDLDQTAEFSRVRAPLGYWNALALVLALAAPVALRLAVDETRRRRVRLAGLAALFLLLTVVGLTYSRGGVVVLAVGIAVALALSRARLRSLVLLALAVVATIPPLALAFTRAALTTDHLPVAARIDDGLLLGGVMVAALIVLVLGGLAAIALERRMPASPIRSRRIGWLLVAVCVVAVGVGVIGVAVSQRGLTGSISHGLHQFTRPHGVAVTDPHRLLATSSNNRWVWWREAVGAFSDHPARGSGAGSFPVLHTEYRTNGINVRQAHSLPVELLAETGVVGTVLALGGLLALIVAGILFVRRMVPGRERALAAALAAGGVAFLVHGLYDWDWEIPGATIPALLFLGVLAGSAGRARAAGRARPAAAALAPEPAAGRGLVLAALTVLVLGVVVSAALPALSASKTSAAVVASGEARAPVQVRDAGAQAELAARLDPLSADPLLAEADVAQRQRRFGLARRLLIEAVGREPSDLQAWDRLAELELRLGDSAGARRAVRRALAIDPRDLGSLELAERAIADETPPQGSATATGTPLPAAGG